MCSFGGLRYRSGSRQVLALGLPTPQGRAQIVAPAGTGVGLAGRRRGLVEVGQLRADLIDVRAHRGLARVYAGDLRGSAPDPLLLPSDLLGGVHRSPFMLVRNET